MKEPYIEEVAIHDGPESCADVRKDAGEALTGARAGWAIEPRNVHIRGADAVEISGRQHHRRRYAQVVGEPRAVCRTWACTHISMRENREVR